MSKKSANETLTSLRGMHDLLPEQMARHRFVIDQALTIAQRFGFQEIETPILEPLAVFQRTLGETSDIVTKEMYQFEDKNGEAVTLRPENTASVMRAFTNHGLAQSIPVKFFYAGAMFRYERPQKGRLRQFHQIGIELIGPSSPQADIEVIACGDLVLKTLGLKDGITLELNSLGNPESRADYRAALITYFSRYQQDLSEESRQRLHRNPMRILDSKQAEDKEIVQNAPQFTDYLDSESQQFFDQVQNGLQKLNIPYRHNDKLVRGLDYYGHTAFEFVSDALGAQATVMGGGRYDGLADYMNFPSMPAVGWAAGIERLAMLIDAPPAPQRPIAMIPLGEAAEVEALSLAMKLREQGFYVEAGYSGSMTKRLKQANRMQARLALIMGDEELAQKKIIIRNLDAGDQIEVAYDEIMVKLHEIMH